MEFQDASCNEALLSQGADLVATDGNLSAGLWFSHAPSLDGRKTGTIGGCELDGSARATDFLAGCADHLHREQQCKVVIGPMNGNTWLRHRLILESSGRAPFAMEPFEPEYFQGLFREAGFEVLSTYSSSSIDLRDDQPDYSRLGKRISEKGCRVRKISEDSFEADLRAIFQLSLECFRDNFLYTSLAEEAFMGAYLSSREIVDPDFVLIAELEEKPVGFVFCLPDQLAVARGEPPALIVKTLATSPRYRSVGLGTWLVAIVQEQAKEKGYTEAIHALQFEDNSSLRISRRFRAKPFRKYALMAKRFPGP